LALGIINGLVPAIRFFGSLVRPLIGSLTGLTGRIFAMGAAGTVAKGAIAIFAGVLKLFGAIVVAAAIASGFLDAILRGINPIMEKFGFETDNATDSQIIFAEAIGLAMTMLRAMGIFAGEVFILLIKQTINFAKALFQTFLLMDAIRKMDFSEVNRQFQNIQMTMKEISDDVNTATDNIAGGFMDIGRNIQDIRDRQNQRIFNRTTTGDPTVSGLVGSLVQGAPTVPATAGGRGDIIFSPVFNLEGAGLNESEIAALINQKSEEEFERLLAAVREQG